MKKITFLKDTSGRAGLYWESRAEASLPCFTDCVGGLCLSPVSLEPWELSEGTAKGCGCPTDPSSRFEGLNALLPPKQPSPLRGLSPWSGWRITSVLMNKTASTFGAERS